MKLSDGENQEKYFVPSRARCVKGLCAVLVLLLSLLWTTTGVSAETVFSAKKAVHAVFSVDDLSYHDQMFAEHAVYSCLCATTTDKKYDRAMINAKRLLAVERQQNIPEFMIGMTLAAACSESCYNDKAKGDHKFSKTGKPKALGIVQLWPWTERYGVDRLNLESSATFWLGHIKKQLKKTKKRCKPRTKTLAWKQAWVHAVRAPKKGGRCREVTKHWRKFKKLQKIKRSIKAGELDGC